MKRLAILSTHPIQYNAPLFRLLHEDDGIELHVFFSKTWEQVKFDPDFQRDVVWDIPVSEGYPHTTFDASSKAGKTSLVKAIRDFEPDAILIYGWNFPGHLATMRAFHGSISIWFRGDSHLLNPQPFWKKALRRLSLNWVYLHVDIAFTVGKANEDYYLWSGIPPIKLIRAPHSVDNDFWTQNDGQRRTEAVAWRTKLGIPSDAPIIGFAGKLEPLKQVGPLLDAVMQTPSAHLVIAGSGPLESSLKEKAYGSNRIHFLGFINQSQMPVFYRLVDVLALVSYSETWGLCINEALASGTPCVISDRAGCAEDLAPSEWAVTLDPFTKKDWVHTIKNQLQIKNRDQSWRGSFLKKHSHESFVDALKMALTQ
ncbi:glycosyltransferase family 4 protein [Flavobacteriales bacterium]|nr:glycosyltransferase family 4 protein [Flavobacteriales bacterium]